jgi:hypothetical protein
MKYLSEVTFQDVLYEAWVDVHEDGDADFSTVLGFIDDRVCDLDDIPDAVQDDLLDTAIEWYREDNGADEAREVWRDA